VIPTRHDNSFEYQDRDDDSVTSPRTGFDEHYWSRLVHQHLQEPIITTMTPLINNIPDVREETIRRQMYDSKGTILLNEQELTRHCKKFKTLPKSPIKGYDDWKTQLEVDQLYWEKVEKTTKKHLIKVEKSIQAQSSSLSRPTLLPEYVDNNHVLLTYEVEDSPKSIMEISMDSTIPTVEGHMIPSHYKKKARGWSFLNRNVNHKK